VFVSVSGSSTVVCALLPRFELVVSARGRSELLGLPVAIAPEPGSQLIGQVSAAAEAFGIGQGMRLGEAMSRCRTLALIPPDPAGVRERWEQMLSALEAIGAAVEPVRPGLACFDARGLLGLHGGIEPLLRAARRALGSPARFGVAPTRFAAFAAATRARARSPLIFTGGAEQARAFLAPLPVELLRDGLGEQELAALVAALERLGIDTLGQLAALPRAAVADRFGRPGLRAHDLARGTDTRLRPRERGEVVRETLELPESSSGTQLERALELLIDRLLARGERRGRTLRAVVLSAALVERGGTWSQRVTFRESLGDPARIRLALALRLRLLPAPAQTLSLEVERFGPPAGEQRTLLKEPARARRERLGEAVRQVRAGAGPEGVLRILHIDPRSRFPERRWLLTPFEP